MLHALTQLAEDEGLVGDPAFEMKPVAYLIVLSEEGRFLGYASQLYTPPLEPGKKKPGKPIAKRLSIPRQFNIETGAGRASGDFAYFLVDKAEYVLGCVPDGKGAAPSGPKSLSRQKLFRDQVAECHRATNTSELQAVLTFLDDVMQGGLSTPPPPECGPGDQFAFQIRSHDAEGRLAHRVPAVASWWRGRCQKKATSESTLNCLITGQPITKLALFPLIKRVPGGAMAGAGIVSFNAPAFESYGWSGKDNRSLNAPISPEAAQKAATALNRLLDSAFETQDGEKLKKRHIRLDATTVLAYWSGGTGEGADWFGDCLEVPDVQQVGSTVETIWRGKVPPDFDADTVPFFAVTLSGAQGRVIVRDWYQSTVKATQKAVAEHFQALELDLITRAGEGKTLPPVLSLRAILESIVVDGDQERIPPPLSAQMTRAALGGANHPYPVTALQRGLQRYRAEITDDSWLASRRRDVLASLCKAFLCRNFKSETEPNTDPTRLMNPMNPNPGYLAGRLLAAYGEMQRLAQHPNKINATVIDKYYGSFSVAPGPLLPGLDKLHVSHRRSALKNVGAKWVAPSAARLADNIDKIYAALQTTQSWQRLDLRQQAEFVLGFHHQTRWHRMSGAERDAWIASRSIDLDSPDCILSHKLQDETIPDAPATDTSEADF